MSNKRPVIGIAYSDSSVRDNEMRIRTYVSRKYFHAVQLAGGLPILLPAPALPQAGFEKPDLAGFVDRYLGMIDGLLLPGGEDVHPRYQNEDPAVALDLVNPFRDEFELKLAKVAYEQHKMPVLGICRGCQVIAIALGGKVHQDLGGIARVQHSQKAPRWAVSHQLKIESGSKLASVLKDTNEVFTNSFHHQAIKEIPQGFICCARAGDGVIEAVECEIDRFYIGVQWHPEETFSGDQLSRNLFNGLIEAATRHAISARFN
ncbi:MAG: gamma-glutamyl-gamma-aminobutyrate hydrolase family protein [Candidatus Riflebacteria bacterium]|nr:gamma-glutamyl-gamma-aminobutyrate hydrolase family protein [Candidatus Riflebacteria bacterium]